MQTITGFIRNRCVKNRILNLMLIICMLICSSFTGISQAEQLIDKAFDYEAPDTYETSKAPVRGSIISGLGIVELDKASAEETTVTQRINNDADSLQKRAGRIIYEISVVLMKCTSKFISTCRSLCGIRVDHSLCSRMVIYIHNKDGSKPPIISVRSNYHF